MNETSLTDTAVAVLNELQANNTEACSELLVYRVKASAGHSTIQVQGKGDKTTVGLLAVVNGILAAAGQPRIAMIRDEQENCLGFLPCPVTTPK